MTHPTENQSNTKIAKIMANRKSLICSLTCNHFAYMYTIYIEIVDTEPKLCVNLESAF